MPEVEIANALAPDRIDGARSALNEYDRKRPDLVALAAVTSLARSIEPELLRSLRLGLGPEISGTRVTVATESALWFSNFVESRGADAITLLPEAVQVLRPRLARDRQLLDRAREIIEESHKSAPDVLQWEERVVYLALTGQNSMLDEEALRGVRTISNGTRLPLVNWITEMWLRLPPEACRNALMVKMHHVALGLALRWPPGSRSQAAFETELILDFSSLSARELGVALRDNRFVIGHLPEAEFGIEVPDLEPVELDISFGADRWDEQRFIERDQVTEIDAPEGTIRLRTLAGQIHELNVGFFVRNAEGGQLQRLSLQEFFGEAVEVICPSEVLVLRTDQTVEVLCKGLDRDFLIVLFDAATMLSDAPTTQPHFFFNSRKHTKFDCIANFLRSRHPEFRLPAHPLHAHFDRLEEYTNNLLWGVRTRNAP
jgi:hypothetical protein